MARLLEKEVSTGGLFGVGPGAPNVGGWTQRVLQRSQSARERPGMIYSLYATGTGDASASLDVREDDTIIGFTIELWVPAPTDGLMVTAELSFLSTISDTVNDTQGVLGQCNLTFDLVTSGSAIPRSFVYVGPIAIPINAGERVYLLGNTNGAVTWNGRSFLYTSRGGGTQRATRRR